MAGLTVTSTSLDLMADARDAGPSQQDGPSTTSDDGHGQNDESDVEIQKAVENGGQGLLEEEGGAVDPDSGRQDVMNEDGSASPRGRRVKVYELRNTSWFDRGTGYCKGVYDDTQDLALLLVEAEPNEADRAEGSGGFLKDELLLSSQVERNDIYARQQDTLIVWTEPATQLDIALSFQDAAGCEDIWSFICDVQKHFANIPTDAEMQAPIPSSSSPLQGSPLIGVIGTGLPQTEMRTPWQTPTLANIKEQEMLLRMQAKSAQGREKAVEHIINDAYILQLIGVFEQAEDLESLEDLHALCSLMQTILMFNDNGIIEYVLQDAVFEGVIGMLEYDPDFPNLKAAYRQFFNDTAKFRQVVEIKDPNIRTKIHQTYRVNYLKDVVLARVLDDPTYGILNGFVFFNQVDIINHIQSNEATLSELFTGFKEASLEESPEKPLDERKRDVVLFLHQLVLMGKSIQIAHRLTLYRNLMERGLLFVVEWAFRRHEVQLLHPGAEMLTLVVEHDVNAVRMHVLKEEEQKRQTLITSVIQMMSTSKNLGLLSQMADTVRTLLDSGPEGDSFVQRKEGPVWEGFVAYIYEHCISQLYKPLLDAPEITASTHPPVKFARETSALLQHLVELLSFSIQNGSQSHRASFFILSNPILKKIVSFLYLREKPLRHAALRFVRACLRTPNHFVHRNYVKNDLLVPLIDLLERESTRDNMMTSACMEVLDIIRKENIKPVINYLFENLKPRLETLSTRPCLRSSIQGLTLRWEQNNEPPPAPPVRTEAESSKAWSRAVEAEEEDYFNGSDEEEIGPTPPIPTKRKRMLTHGGGPAAKREKSSSPDKGVGGALGLDYDDEAESPTKVVEELEPEAKVEEDLGDVQMKMRAKRQREEEEDEGFGGLLVSKGGGGKKEDKAVTTTPVPVKLNLNVGQAAAQGTPTKEGGGKKLRLNLFGKRVGSVTGGAGANGGTSPR